jgi:hypothetical protein
VFEEMQARPQWLSDVQGNSTTADTKLPGDVRIKRPLVASGLTASRPNSGGYGL